MPVRIQSQDFDAGAEIARLREGDPKVGAVAAFIGVARDVNDGETVAPRARAPYPGRTAKGREKIVIEARARWRLIEVLVIHRVGELRPTDQIVLVAVTSAHRGDAFAACEFIMDYLKTRAPFWKKESTPQGTHWVEARDSDDQAAGRWQGPKADVG